MAKYVYRSYNIHKNNTVYTVTNICDTHRNVNIYEECVKGINMSVTAIRAINMHKAVYVK